MKDHEHSCYLCGETWEESQPRDCGEDSKRLDWLQDCISNGRDVPNVDPLSDNSLREAIDAAMSETGRGEKSQT